MERAAQPTPVEKGREFCRTGSAASVQYRLLSLRAGESAHAKAALQVRASTWVTMENAKVAQCEQSGGQKPTSVRQCLVQNGTTLLKMVFAIEKHV
jgi:hypothetical protein